MKTTTTTGSRTPHRNSNGFQRLCCCLRTNGHIFSTCRCQQLCHNSSAQCGSDYHDWNDVSTRSSTYTSPSAGHALTSGWFPGESPSNASNTCGYGGSSGADSCVSCFGADEIQVVYSDCTGKCVDQGTSTAAPTASNTWLFHGVCFVW